jgi:hypothetical protein
MLCPHCGSEVSDDTRSCPRCGAVLALDSPVLASTDVSRDIPQQEVQVRRLFRVMFLAVVCAIGGFFFLHHRQAGNHEGGSKTEKPTDGPVTVPQKITPATFSVDPGGYRSYVFNVGAECRSPRLRGTIRPLSSGTSGVEMLVFDNRNFELWKSRRPTTVIYRAASIRNVVDVALPPNIRQYFVVFRNEQKQGNKLLQADVTLACVR